MANCKNLTVFCCLKERILSKITKSSLQAHIVCDIMDLLGGFVRPFLFGNIKNAGVKATSHKEVSKLSFRTVEDACPYNTTC